MTEILLFYIQKEQRNAVFLSQNHREIVGDDELFREDFPAVIKRMVYVKIQLQPFRSGGSSACEK